MSALRVAALDASLSSAWAALFERAHVACFCRYWHFVGTKNDWLARCATEPAVSRAEALDAIGAIEARSTEASGLVAIDGDRVVGWMKVAPRASLPKLRGLPVYRGRDVREGEAPNDVWVVGCVLVDPSERKRGVARALVEGVPAFVRAQGGRAVVAYPRHPLESQPGPLHDEEAWMGPEALFVDAGFSRVAEDAANATAAYPVYRLNLG